MKRGSTRRGAPFFARSPARQRCWGCAPTGRGDFAARKGCFCPCTVQGASQRGHSLSQKRMAPLEPQEKGLDWQSRARMTFVPPEWKCLRGGIASLAANGSARRFASASIIRCRSAHLVEVRSNLRLPRHYSMRRAPAMPLFRKQSAAEVTSLAPHDSKARLISVTIRRRFMAKPCTPHPHCAACAVLQAANCQCAGSRGKAPCVLLGV